MVEIIRLQASGQPAARLTGLQAEALEAAARAVLARVSELHLDGISSDQLAATIAVLDRLISAQHMVAGLSHDISSQPPHLPEE
jgi:hypothetical protein